MVGGQLSIFFEDCQLDPARLLADTGISNECTVEARLTAAWRWPHVGTTPAESAHFAHRPWLYEVHSGGLGLTKVQEGVYNITAERSPGVAHPGEWKIAVLRAPADAAVVDSVGLLPPRSRSLLGPCTRHGKSQHPTTTTNTPRRTEREAQIRHRIQREEACGRARHANPSR
eukprot:Hpha_TRINITY_DN14690_c0_g2::TRINITY_DN14690_c0_g2_i6::g.48199::m.48199